MLIYLKLFFQGSGEKNYDIEIDDANVTVYKKGFIDGDDVFVEFNNDLNKPVVNGFINVIQRIPDEATVRCYFLKCFFF